MKVAGSVILMLLLCPAWVIKGQESNGSWEPFKELKEEKKQDQSSQALTNDSILKLVGGGLGDEAIISMVKTHPGNYSLGVDDILALKKAGVSGKVITAMLNSPSATAHPPEPAVSRPPQPQSKGEACSKVISFGMLVHTPKGVQLIKGEPSWLNNWVRKNFNKHPDICFSQSPIQDRANYLVVLSQSPHYFHGFEPVVRKDTSTTDVFGNGTAMDSYGDIWNYTYDGTVSTTTTTQETVPYEISSNTLYASAYDTHGALVSQSYHVYKRKSGGDNAGIYNLGNMISGINARGHLINTVVRDIEDSEAKK